MSARSGPVRVRVVQFEVKPGRPRTNADRMLHAIARARDDGIRLAVFPEMAIPGYLLGDEWERQSFLRDCEAAGEAVRQASEGITVVFGNVAVDWTRRNEDGRVRKYNACWVAHSRRFTGPEGSPYPFVVKALLPNYREFDECRHFHDARKLAAELNRPLEQVLRPVVVDGLRLGCVLCEDAWDTDYAVSPIGILAGHGVDLFLNISASPFTLDKNDKRNRVLSEHVRRAARPLVYCNHTGIQDNGKTVFTFDGSSCVYDARGGCLPAGRPFQETEFTFALPLERATAAAQAPRDTVAALDEALLYGTRKFMERVGVRRVVVGASGGIDSAVVAALYSRILPPGDLLLVNMPSRHNSPTTRGLARELAANLDALYTEAPIEDSVTRTCRQIESLSVTSASGRNCPLKLTPFMQENVQARDRSARVLAALAAAFGGVFTCNGNKSELTVGYATLYGDLGGYLANIADLWKTEVYALARHMNTAVFGRTVIPAGSLSVTPSAELSPDQNVDEGKGDPIVYPYHDTVFRAWVEWWNRATPEDLLTWYAEGTLEQHLGYEGRVASLFPAATAFVADLERWWNAYQGMGVAKRIQAPPVLAVKRRAFGFDHREAQMGPRYTRRYEELKALVLAADGQA
jgi:NAD+ synthase (glutamine-hydrolysing)